MRKRVLKTTVAATLAFGTVAGFPWSGAGVQQLLGGASAYAAEASTAGDWMTRVQNAYGELTDEEKTIVSNAKTALMGINPMGNEALVDGMVDLLYEKLEDAEAYDDESDLAIDMINFVQEVIGSFLNTDPALLEGHLQAIRTDEPFREFVNKLSNTAGIPLDGGDDLIVSDFIAFTNAFEEEFLKAISIQDAVSYINSDKSADDVTALKVALKADIKAALGTVLDEHDDLKISQIFNFYGSADAITDALAEAYLAMTDVFDDSLEAHSVLARGLVRAESVLTPTTVSGTTPLLVPSLKVFGLTIPNSVIVWSSDNDLITYSSGSFALSGSASANTAHTAQVEAKVLDQLIFTGTISLTRTPASAGPGPSTTPPATSPNIVPKENQTEQSQTATDAVNSAKEQLAQASPEEQGKIVRETKAAVKKAVENIGKLTILNAVTVADDGKATASIDVDALVAEIETILEQVAALNEALKELDPNAEVDPEITLDFGTVDSDWVAVGLTKAVLDALKEKGISNVRVEVNGSSVGFNANDVEDSVEIVIGDIPTEDVEQLTDNKVVSQPQNVQFLDSNGIEITQFTTPVELSFPVLPNAEIDTELLTLAKLIEERLLYYVGMYDDEVETVRGMRDSLSTYAVVENRVAFGDTGSVEDWAGRQIQVVAAKGIVNGRGDGQYDPEAYVTRAEFAKMVSKAFSIDGAAATETFSDVGDGDWFQPYVAAVQHWNITNGRTPDTFDPDAPITRAEMATMIARALQNVTGDQALAAADDILAQFTDAADIHDSLRDGVALAADLEIIIGHPDSSFDPNGLTTRAQAAVMIYRTLYAIYQ